MVIFFTEQDLVSFGNYMISPERIGSYLENKDLKDKVGEYLKQVNTYDIEMWNRALLSQQQKQSDKQPTTLDELPVDAELSNLTD